MVDMDVSDIQRDVVGTVMMYRGRPVYILGCDRNKNVRITYLISQKEDVAPFTLKDFTVASRRIGYVNTMGSVVYVTRTPIRKFYMGFHKNNVQIRLLNMEYPHGSGNARERIRSLNVPEVGQALMNRYPSFLEALERTNAFGGAVAFDKQFAVGNNCIFYKDKYVGTVKADAKTVDDIVFDKDCKHLGLLLNDNYTRTIRRSE